MENHRDDNCYSDCGHHLVAATVRFSRMPLHAYCLPEGRNTCKRPATRAAPVMTRRDDDNLGSCHPNGKCEMDFDTQEHHCRPETTESAVLRYTGQTQFLSSEGKKFRYQFQRFGFQKMSQNRTQNVEIEHLASRLVAHKVIWRPASKARFHFRWLNIT